MPTTVKHRVYYWANPRSEKIHAAPWDEQETYCGLETSKLVPTTVRRWRALKNICRRCQSKVK